MKLRNIVWISALVLTASALAGVGAPMLIRAESSDPPAAGTLSVVGTGVVKTKPDTARISAGVTTEAAKADEAMKANATAMQTVIDALKAEGIDSKDVQTEYVSVQPRYDDAGSHILGFTASNSVAAIVRDITRAGAVIDAAITAGANTVGGPSLSREDQDELYRDALADAVAKARLKATSLARAAGLTLGDIKSLSEGTQEAIPFESFSALRDAASAPPIEPGTTEITANVRVVFAVA